MRKYSPLPENLGQLGHGVLRVGHREPIARHDDHFLGGAEHFPRPRHIELLVHEGLGEGGGAVLLGGGLGLVATWGGGG